MTNAEQQERQIREAILQFVFPPEPILQTKEPKKCRNTTPWETLPPIWKPCVLSSANKAALKCVNPWKMQVEKLTESCEEMILCLCGLINLLRLALKNGKGCGCVGRMGRPTIDIRRKKPGGICLGSYDTNRMTDPNGKALKVPHRHNKSSICWNCSKPPMACSWLCDMVPQPGMKYYVFDANEIPKYVVVDCGNYRKEKAGGKRVG